MRNDKWYVQSTHTPAPHIYANPHLHTTIHKKAHTLNIPIPTPTPLHHHPSLTRDSHRLERQTDFVVMTKSLLKSCYLMDKHDAYYIKLYNII